MKVKFMYLAIVILLLSGCTNLVKNETNVVGNNLVEEPYIEENTEVVKNHTEKKDGVQEIKPAFEDVESINEIVEIVSIVDEKELTLVDGSKITLVVKDAKNKNDEKRVVIETLNTSKEVLDSKILKYPDVLPYSEYVQPSPIDVNYYNNDYNPDFVLDFFEYVDYGDYIRSMYTIINDGKIKKIKFKDEMIGNIRGSDTIIKYDNKIFSAFYRNGKGSTSFYEQIFVWDNTNNEFYKLDTKEYYENILNDFEIKNANKKIVNNGIVKPNKIYEDLPFEDDDFWYTYDFIQDSSVDYSNVYIHDISYSDYSKIFGGLGDAIGVGPIMDIVSTSNFIEKINNYDVNNLSSPYIDSCWVEGVDGYGIGEKIIMTGVESCEKIYNQGYIYIFDDKKKNIIVNTIRWLFAAKDGGTSEGQITDESELANYHYKIDGISLINGYAKTDDLWKANSRVKKLKVVIDDKVEYILKLEDTNKLQCFDDVQYENANIFNPINVEFEILEVYEGDKYQDTALTYLCPHITSNISWGGR